MTLSRLLTLISILLLLAITVIYVAFRILRLLRAPTHDYALLPDEDAPSGVKRGRRERPCPLNLGAAGDCKIDVYELRQRSTGNGVGASCVDLGSEKYSVPNTEKAVKGNGNGEVLTPFTPARARARRYGAGDVEHRDAEDDDLGLGRYFFSDGVGIKRYVSWGLERGWREA